MDAWLCSGYGSGGCPDGSTPSSESYNICLPVSCGPDSDGIACVLVDGGPPFSGEGTCCAGRCVDVWSDPTSCGACGNACDVGMGCLWGVCGSTPCYANRDPCLLDAGRFGQCCAGECVDLSADNCGACGIGCPIGSTCQVQSGCVTDAGPAWSCVQDSDCPNGRSCVIGAGCVVSSCDAGTYFCSFASATDGGAALGVCCSQGCVDIADDPSNCGACGQSCPPGFPCANGSCVGMACNDESCIPPTCGPDREGAACSYGPGQIGYCCDGLCVGASSCGYCGTSCSGYCNPVTGTCIAGPVPQGCLQSCAPGTTCAMGVCVGSLCTWGAYPLPWQAFCLAQDGEVGTCCFAGACAHLADDVYNCGACGIACPPGATCQNGLCNGMAECRPGRAGSYCNLDAGFSFLCCPGVGCLDTSSDPSNCGACANTCASGQVCDAGSCTTGS